SPNAPQVGTPLHAAATKGRTTVIPSLLNAGAANTARASDRATPAKLALIHGHVALAATFASSLSPTEIAELARRAAFQVDVATILTLLDQGRSDLIAALPVAALSRSLELGH